MPFSIPAAVVLAAVVVTAAIYDLRYRRIPNWLTVGGVIAGAAVNAIVGPPAGGLAFALTGLAVGFGAYFLLYALHAMGAGDVKLMAAVGTLVGWRAWFAIFVCTAILGGLASLVLMFARKRVKTTLWNVGFIFSEMRSLRPAYLGREELDVKSRKGLSLPHGALIAAGTICFLCLGAYLG